MYILTSSDESRQGKKALFFPQIPPLPPTTTGRWRPLCRKDLSSLVNFYWEHPHIPSRDTPPSWLSIQSSCNQDELSQLEHPSIPSSDCCGWINECMRSIPTPSYQNTTFNENLAFLAYIKASLLSRTSDLRYGILVIVFHKFHDTAFILIYP